MEDAVDTRNAKTIITKIRQLLLNYDLTLSYARGEIAIRQATMKMCEGSRRKYEKRRFIEAKIDKERFEIFMQDIENSKNELLENIEMIINKYNSKYKEVFVLYFLQDKTYQEIADQTSYSFDMINKIIRKFKNDLITFYIP